MVDEDRMPDGIVNAEVVANEPVRSGKGGCSARFVVLGLLSLGLLLCGWCVIPHLGFRVSWDPHQVTTALAKIEPMEMPAGLDPDRTSWNIITGHKSVGFKHATTRSYLGLSIGPNYKLEHEGTRQDSYDRGVTARGGTPARPTSVETFNYVVRGRPAEFIYKRFANFETVSGFFQGRKQPVILDARFDYSSFAPGTARELLKHFQPDDDG